MRANAKRAGAVVTMAAVMTAGLGALASPASAQTQETGLVLYSGKTPVAHYPAPTGSCEPVPPTADLLIGWSNVQQTLFYYTTDCSGWEVGLGTLRTFGQGEFKSFRAY